jgi:hypothetical protein
MRYLVVLIVLLLPINAGAEQRSRSQRHAPTPSQRPAQPPRAAQARPVIPSSVAPQEWQRLDMRGNRSHSSWRRFHQQGKMPPWWFRPGSRNPFYGGSYYALPYSGYYPGEEAGYSTAPPAEAEAASMRTAGTLRLDITPATGLQYYVDGMYIGSSSELGTEFEVNAGARRIEIRAEGYKPVVFDARFVPGGIVTRRGALEPLQDSATLPRAAGNRTMFVIPGCFMGNARPDPGSLPKGCDIARLITR